MELLTAIKTRSSALSLSEPAPKKSDLETILAAGVCIPDHGRLAPSRFIVLQEEGLKQLSEAMTNLFIKNNPDAPAAKIEQQRKKAYRAPVVITVAARIERDHKVPEIEQIMAVSAGVQNMFLVAHALGYGAMWKTGGAAYSPEVNTSIGLEPGDQIVAFLYLGTIKGKGPVKPNTLEGVVDWR